MDARLPIFPLVALAAVPAWGQPRPPEPISTKQLGISLEQITGRLKNAEDNMTLVEKQYTERTYSEETTLNHRYNEGEIKYLLGDHSGASVLFYDLVSNPEFKKSPQYPDALFYLSDSLDKQQNPIGARLYLRQLLSIRSKHYGNALIRYIDIAGKVNDFSGIEEYVEQARAEKGTLPPEVAYVYGKWLFRRSDLSLEDRLPRALEVFQALAADRKSPFALPSAYFMGVCWVQLGLHEKALAQFRAIAATKGGGARETRVRELAVLALGRLLYESGKYDEAIQTYQTIPRDSEYFPDQLFEVAWAKVRKGEFEGAKNATEILKVASPDATFAPEAQILQGHLLLRLKKYNEANDTYTQVINTYAPVRDEIDALLAVNKNPIAYFDNILAKNERQLDVGSLLPPVALKWATTQQEVAEAIRMVNDLEAGRRGITEGEDIAARILKGLDERGLETFPEIQDGYTRTDAVDSAITLVNEDVIRVERQLVTPRLSADSKKGLDSLGKEKASLQARFASLPKTQDEVDARKRRLQERIDSLDREAFRLGYEFQSMDAILAAIEKWAADTRPQRKASASDEKAFAENVKHETDALNASLADLESLRKALRDERASVATSLSGEAVIRMEFSGVLDREHELLTSAEKLLDLDGRRLIERGHEIRSRAQSLRQRVVAAKELLRSQMTKRGEQIREKVLNEQRLLGAYAKEAQTVSVDARNLVGRIAFDSFRRVRQQFYELVLKADVGILDVAFTRKQDKTGEIQKLSSHKDNAMKALDAEFKEILKDAD